MIILGFVMEDFLAIVTSFPVIIYTILLGVMIVLALLTVVGLLDIEGPEFDFNMDGDIDFSVDAPTVEGLAGFMLAWGLTGVPITILLCLLSLVGWFICYHAVYFSFDYIPSGLFEYIVGSIFLVGSFYASLPITAFFIRPLKVLFAKPYALSNKNILGHTVIVRSSKVNANFGEATFNDGGAGLLLRVRRREENSLKKGDLAVLVEYSEKDGSYLVAPENEFSR